MSSIRSRDRLHQAKADLAQEMERNWGGVGLRIQNYR